MIKFKCFMNGVAEEMPIIRTKDHEFDWVSNAKEYYSNNHAHHKITSCPGIFSLLSRGWIQRSYQDFIIDTSELKTKGFEYGCAIEQRETVNGDIIEDYLNAHPPDQLANFFQEWRHKNDYAIKIQSPWFVEIPKGYALMYLPIMYNDDQRFTAAAGLVRGNTFLSVQLFWHENDSKQMVKRGTPLQQYILVKDLDQSYQIETVENAREYLMEINS